jgi:hypothetical protein
VGKVGILVGLRSEAAPALHHQRVPIYGYSPTSERRGSLPERGTHLRGEVGGGSGSQALLGDLVYRSEQLREAVTEVGVLFSDRALQVAMWRQPARRDRYLELEAGVKSWRDVGYHTGGTGDEDRDKDLRLHLCVFG